MYCTVCGYYAGDEYRFCANCGALLNKNRLDAPESGETAEFPQPPAAPVIIADSAPESPNPEISEPPPPETKKEKTYFGKGALVVCLVIIAVLSFVSGMFIGLYIHEKIRQDAANGGGYHSQYK